jgi:hypothetical protein
MRIKRRRRIYRSVIEAEIVYGRGALRLSPNEISVVPSGDLIIRLKGATERDAILLDGRKRPFQRSSDGYLLGYDTTRSTGFHHLQVAPATSYFFGTEDAKLKLDGILRMLEYLGESGLGWSGQLFFADGSYLRSNHVIYGWLDRWADRLLAAANRVCYAPVRAARKDRRVSTRGGRVDVPATVKLLRSRPKEFLEEGEDGLLAVGDKRYNPLKVVAIGQADSVDTPANRRVMWLLGQLYDLCLEVTPALPKDAKEEYARCSAWASRAATCLYLSPLSRLYAKSVSTPPPATLSSVEAVNPDYAIVAEGASLLQELRGPALGRERRAAHAYVKYSDEIYQAFVSFAVAEALGMEKAEGGGGYQFRNADFEMFVNVFPPRDVLRSWRSYSTAPDDFRPDLIIRRAADGAVAVCDAKYRQEKGRASESGRKEVMAYMAAYDLARAVIFYPPKDDALGVYSVSGQGREIAEVTIAPAPDLQRFLRAELPKLLARVFAAPTWRG